MCPHSHEHPAADNVGEDFEPDICLPQPHDADRDPAYELGEALFNAAAGDLRITLETKGTTSPFPRNANDITELWKAASVHKLSVAAKLREVGEFEIAADLDECHSRVIYARCNKCRSVTIHRNRCDRFYCPECAPALTKRRHAGIAWWLPEVRQPKHVVLTVRNIPDLTKGHVMELKRWFAALRRRKFARSWRGGFYSIEVTNEGRGWHLHIHAMIDADFIDAPELARTWDKVTNGHGKIVKVRDARHASYLKEVAKYVVKGSQLAKWPAADIVSFIQAFTNVRTFGVFGVLYAARQDWQNFLEEAEASVKKCACGSNDVSYFSEMEWHRLNAPRPPTDPGPLPDHQLQPELLTTIGLGAWAN